MAPTAAHDSSPAWVANLRRAELPIPQTTRRFIPAHKENKHERRCTKKSAEAQETKEAPCNEKVHSGEEIKGGGSVKIDERRRICRYVEARRSSATKQVSLFQQPVRN